MQQPYARRHIEVTLHVSRELASFVVRDEGPGFDHARMLQSAVLDDQEQASTRGLALMRTTFEEVTFNNAGNEVTLVKRCIQLSESLDDDDE